MKRIRLAALAILAAAAAGGATLPAGFTETSWSGIASPTAMAVAPDGRLFVCEQSGALRVIKAGSLLPTPFMTLTVDSTGERGLLGVAFDPDFPSTQYIYVYYTVSAAPVHNRLSRFTADGDAVAPGSEVVLLELDSLSGATNHNGGALHFGADGKLYVGVGENANGANAQTLSNLLGKLLRVGVPPDSLIPTDNPFFHTAAGNNRAIWALGLRNPFTFAVQPGTGRILVNDVGSGAWEEIDDAGAGDNFGWPLCEGVCGNVNFEDPLFAYGHSPSCAIAGGAFYNPKMKQFPASYVGKYFFADLCGTDIRYIDPTVGMPTATTFATAISNPVDVQVDVEGSLYYVARGEGKVYRVTYTGLSVAAIAPTSGRASGGIGVLVTGSSFLSGARLRIGGATASGVTVVGPTQVTGRTPALPAGTLNDVVVSNAGNADTLARGWFADFADVPPTNIFHDDIERIFRAGITAGCGGGGFCPASLVTRAQMAVFLLKGRHGGSYQPPTCSAVLFADVPCPGGQFVDWVNALADEGITAGCGGGNYCPGSPVTRSQMAVLLLKAEHAGGYLPPSCSSSRFFDVPCPGGQFVDWVNQLAEEGITVGCGSGSYCPGVGVPREQVATFLVKTFGVNRP